MKCKHIISILFIFIAGTKAFGQSYFVDDDKTFYGGLILGTNITQVDGDDYVGYDKYGLNVGGIVYTKLAEQIAWSMEILYSQKGSKSNGKQSLQPGIYLNTYGIELNYAEIPIMINYFTKKKSNFGGGFSYSRLASSNEYLTSNLPQNFDQNKYPFKKSDYNIILGGNLHLWQGLFLNIRFQYSLLSIRDKIPQNYAMSAQYNNMWVIRFMYLFF